MEGKAMKRKGFFLNSAVIVLLIPLLLLLATYEDVSSQIIAAQSERSQIERTGDVVSYLNMEFQKALEISGKRAVVTAVDYVATTGKFIPSGVGANTTIAELIKTENFPSGVNYGGYSPHRLMRGQTLQSWFSNMSRLLREQGYTLSGDISSVDLTVAPLDAFTLVIKARIPHVTIADSSGKVVYSGPIPSNGGYVYSTVDLRGLEDPMFSAVTGGRYQRSLQACQYPYPGLGVRPILSVNGSGSSDSPYVIGRFGDQLSYNSTHIWDSVGDYITNLTRDGAPVKTDSLILHDGDLGVLFFTGSSGGSGGTNGWCDANYGYRLNVTITNSAGSRLEDFQVPIHLSLSSSDIPSTPRIKIYDSTCTPVPFWVESWSKQGDNLDALIWVKADLNQGDNLFGIYFDESAPEDWGDPNDVFEFYDDFSGSSLDTTKWNRYNAQVSVSNGILTISNAYAGIYTKKTFTPPVIIEFREYIKNSWAEVYFAVRQSSEPWGPLWWIKKNHIQPASWSYLDDTAYGAYSDEYPSLSTGWHVGTIYWFKSDSRLEWDNGEVIYNTYNTYQDYTGAIALGTWNKNQEWDWIRVRKYANPMPTVSSSGQIETKPSPSGSGSSSVEARAYNIEPFMLCINEMERVGNIAGSIRYVAVPWGMSFLERLEGSDQNHNSYVQLAEEMQDEMGVSYGGKHYPIGLVSFMVPTLSGEAFDEKLNKLFSGILHISPDENVNSVDYCFLDHYFPGKLSITQGLCNTQSNPVYRMYGISDAPNRKDVYFFIDEETARYILGTLDLLQRS